MIEIKTSQILINKITLETIQKNWNHVLSQYQNKEIIDESISYEMILRVPFKTKGSINHMLISSRLKIKQEISQFSITLYCTILKPIIVSLLLGITSSILVFTLSNHLIYSLILLSLISTISLILFLLKITTISKKYLINLKNNSFK